MARHADNSEQLQELLDILQGQLQFLTKHCEESTALDAAIAESPNPQMLAKAKKECLEAQRDLLREVIGNLNPFLTSIVLYQNKLNHIWDHHKDEATRARAEHCAHIDRFEQAKKCESDVSKFSSLLQTVFFDEERFRAAIQRIAEAFHEEGIVLYDQSGANRKRLQRAFYKAFFIYRNHRKMTDMLRASFVFKTFSDLYRGFCVIEREWPKGILRVKDRFALNDAPFGYRDLLINVYAPESQIVCELQLHHVSLYENKKGSHSIYKKARVFNIDGVNKAYMYAEKYIRPQIGNDKEPTPDAPQPGEHSSSTPGGEGEADVGETTSWQNYLAKYRMEKFAKKFEDEGWDEPAMWKEMSEAELKEMGFGGGHLKKWKLLLKDVETDMMPAAASPAVTDEKEGDSAAVEDNENREPSPDLFELLFQSEPQLRISPERQRTREQPVEPRERPRRVDTRSRNIEGKTNEIECSRCHSEMTKMSVGDMYQSGIKCDECHKPLPRSATVYHCSEGRNIEHPNMWDLCPSCAGVTAEEENEGSALRCHCGGHLKKMGVAEPYGPPGRVACDGCGEPARQIVYHCTEGRNSTHPAGYDLCSSCFGSKKSQTKEFVYERDMDDNGLIYWLGTKKGKSSWKNPMSRHRNLIRVVPSSLDARSETADAVVGRDAVTCFTQNEKNSSFIIDLKGVRVLPKHYTLRHFSGSDGHCLRNWVLQASNPDLMQWVTLCRHRNDTSLDGAGDCHTWEVPYSDDVIPFSQFRILQTGPNSRDGDTLALSGFEIYGTVDVGSTDERRSRRRDSRPSSHFESSADDDFRRMLAQMSGLHNRRMGLFDDEPSECRQM